jgi:hypothetical protein
MVKKVIFEKIDFFFIKNKKNLFERTRRRKIAKQFSDGAGVSL